MIHGPHSYRHQPLFSILLWRTPQWSLSSTESNHLSQNPHIETFLLLCGRMLISHLHVFPVIIFTGTRNWGSLGAYVILKSTACLVTRLQRLLKYIILSKYIVTIPEPFGKPNYHFLLNEIFSLRALWRSQCFSVLSYLWDSWSSD